MPKILSIEEKEERKKFKEEQIKDLQEKLLAKKIKLDPARKNNLQYLQRLINFNPEKRLERKPKTNGHAFNPDEFKKEIVSELKSILPENKIVSNGHAPGTNGNAIKPEQIEPAAQASPQPHTIGRDEFYNDLKNTKKDLSPDEINQQHNAPPPPPPPPQPQANNQQAPPEPGPQIKPVAEKIEPADDDRPKITFTDKEVEDVMKLIPEVQSIAANICFGIAEMFGVEPRRLDAEDIPPMSELRKKMIRPGIEVFARKITETMADPNYLGANLAIFTILDAINHGHRVDENGNRINNENNP